MRQFARPDVAYWVDLPLEHNKPAVGAMDTAEQREQGRFSSSIGADSAAQLSRHDIERNVVRCDDAAKSLRQRLCGQNRDHPQRSLSAARHLRRGSSRPSVTIIPLGKNIITTSSNAPTMIRPY